MTADEGGMQGGIRRTLPPRRRRAGMPPRGRGDLPVRRRAAGARGLAGGAASAGFPALIQFQDSVSVQKQVVDGVFTVKSAVGTLSCPFSDRPGSGMIRHPERSFHDLIRPGRRKAAPRTAVDPPARPARAGRLRRFPPDRSKDRNP
ncbi:hypothetical protein GE300_04460 [Rhodobacteraceae bacterium 2CG4]|uniref:Uncharacterized protein n=1 Tax=Halovulum marinum TaxID=2662447 RepID=A0A6L5YYG1_9RHOB|nr:hypothetical protein [Halovulum marinum]MSU88875.1 hypothetical protein [Halovulum marinum]